MADEVELTDAEREEVAETAPLASFRVGKHEVPLLRTKQLTLGDLAILKRDRGIRGMVDLEDGLMEMDPDAWGGLVFVSALRVLPALERDHPDLQAILPMPLVEEGNRLVREALEQALEAKRAEVNGGPPADAGDAEQAPPARKRTSATRGAGGDRT